ncbi:MAG: hypothetical protein C5B49_10725 [Bdellovibrio sp.]|nr:MAG: hypothetical protein C5B49_10725 [Bdellovibrio sp.]
MTFKILTKGEVMKTKIILFTCLAASLFALNAKAQSGGVIPAPPVYVAGPGLCYIHLTTTCISHAEVPAGTYFVDKFDDVSFNAVHCAERALDYKKYCLQSLTPGGPGSPLEVQAYYQVAGVNVLTAGTWEKNLYQWDGATWRLLGY